MLRYKKVLILSKTSKNSLSTHFNYKIQYEYEEILENGYNHKLDGFSFVSLLSTSNIRICITQLILSRLICSHICNLHF